MEHRADLISDKVEVVPVVVLSQTFPARPSWIPEIRDFVRRCLAESPLNEEGTRGVSETVFRALLDAAGPTGSIQVAFRIFPEHVEVDVLHSDTVIQPPTMPGPPISTVIPAPAGPAENVHSQRSHSAHLTQAIRQGDPGRVPGGRPAAAARAGGPWPEARPGGSPGPAGYPAGHPAGANGSGAGYGTDAGPPAGQHHAGSTGN